MSPEEVAKALAGSDPAYAAMTQTDPRLLAQMAGGAGKLLGAPPASPPPTGGEAYIPQKLRELRNAMPNPDALTAAMAVGPGAPVSAMGRIRLMADSLRQKHGLMESGAPIGSVWNDARAELARRAQMSKPLGETAPREPTVVLPRLKEMIRRRELEEQVWNPIGTHEAYEGLPPQSEPLLADPRWNPSFYDALNSIFKGR